MKITQEYHLARRITLMAGDADVDPERLPDLIENSDSPTRRRKSMLRAFKNGSDRTTLVNPQKAFETGRESIILFWRNPRSRNAVFLVIASTRCLVCVMMRSTSASTTTWRHEN